MEVYRSRARFVGKTNEEGIGGRSKGSNIAKPLHAIVGFEPKAEADGWDGGTEKTKPLIAAIEDVAGAEELFAVRPRQFVLCGIGAEQAVLAVCLIVLYRCSTQV